MDSIIMLLSVGSYDDKVFCLQMDENREKMNENVKKLFMPWQIAFAKKQVQNLRKDV